MSTICITGSASGIGAATRDRLEKAGHRVIGVDLHGAEVEADLSTASGRTTMVTEVERLAGGRLDGLVAGAGIQNAPPAAVVSVNYFGAVDTLDGLRHLLAEAGSAGAAGAASAVAISSNSATVVQGIDDEGMAACLAGDEPAAQSRMEEAGGFSAYPTTKLALACWVRQRSVSPEWIGAGVRLNAIAPGPVATPLTREMGDAVLGFGDVYPVPIRRVARSEEIAAVIDFLLSPDASYIVGAVLPVDGGGDAAARGDDWPSPRR